MTTLQEVIEDFRAECDALDVVLSKLDEDGWLIETPAVGWDTRDTVAHLADTSDIMYDAITGGPRDLFSDAQAAAEASGVSSAGDPKAVDAFTATQVAKGRKMSVADVHAWWRSASARLLDELGRCEPGKKYRWGPNLVSPLSLASARIMETWAHSLDVHEAAGVEYTDTDRVRHVAFLGLRAMPYAFFLEGLEAPAPLRVELTSPSGGAWTLGPDDAPNVVRGSASDWCRLVARRDRDGAAQRLRAEGPDAENIIKHARAFL
jgi:uncharacterized protein (TIGR03084 family)